MPESMIFLGFACAFGLFMAWGIGANDVANAMGTSVGSRALTIRNAIIIAAIFEFAGAFLAGGSVTETISKGITDIDYFVDEPDLLIYGMLASMLASALWLLVATHFGWPVSTTHSIVGAIVGFTAVGVGVHAVHWGEVGIIAMSWIISPLMGGLIAYLLFTSVQMLIFRKARPFTHAKRTAPFYIFLSAFVIAMITFTKGLKHIGLDLSNFESILYSIIFSLLVTGVGMIAINRIEDDPNAKRKTHFANVEKVFAVLMIFTACAMAFAHGSNDVANAVGPMSAVLSAISGDLSAKSHTPTWVLLVGSIGIVTGLVMYGHKVMATVGSGITQLTPSRGFAATLAAAITVVVASGTGLPISTTHTLVGAILGVGLARGIGAINLRVVRAIFISWLITLPAGAFLAIIIFYIFKYSFA
jgi:PiT family inorganic phosphate transporter